MSFRLTFTTLTLKAAQPLSYQNSYTPINLLSRQTKWPAKCLTASSSLQTEERSALPHEALNIWRLKHTATDDIFYQTPKKTSLASNDHRCGKEM